MRYIATGRVHPERADIRFNPIEWQIPDYGRVVARCEASQITVVIEATAIVGWPTAGIAAEHFAAIVVGALGFSLGSGYYVEVLQVMEEDGTPHVFDVRPAGAAPDDTLGFDPNGPLFHRALQLATANVFFRLALRDFLRGLKDPIDCAMYCYRAIESIKAACVFKAGGDGWEDMHAALGADRASIDATIKRFVDPVRRGSWIEAPTTDANTRWQMLVLTRDILLKFLDLELPIEQPVH